MKNLIKIITVSMLCMFLYACIDDFKVGNAAIDKPAGVDISIDTVFSKRELARRFMWGLYHYVPDPVPMNEASSILMTSNWYEALSDCVHSFLSWSAVNNTWYNATYNQNGDGSAARWKFSQSYCYQGMRVGHILLENIDRVPDMTKNEKQRLKAEAKIIIAGKHWELFRQYGGIPLGDREFLPDESGGQFPRATIEETYNYMIQLLDEAIAEPELKFKLADHEIDNNPEEWFGRLTKAAAYAQKMLVQLAAASPIYNDDHIYYRGEITVKDFDPHLVWWGERKQSLWDDLKKTCEDFIAANQAAGNPYKMLEAEPGNWPFNYMDVFRNAYWNRNTSELVYVAPDWPALGRPSYWSSVWSGSETGWGTQCPTAEYMEMFDNSDGTPFDTTGVYIHNLAVKIESGSPNYYEVPASVIANPPRNIYEDRDPRLYATIWVQKRDQRWTEGPIGTSEATGSMTRYEQWPGGIGMINPDPGTGNIGESYRTGMLIRKFMENHIRNDHMSRKYCFPILRMGGFHLIYAEALAETGNLSGAIAQMDLVRARVGLPSLSRGDGVRGRDLSTKEGVINEILRERACELTYEDTRFNDMIRRKLGDNFKKPLHGVWTYRVDGIADIGSIPYPDLWYVKRKLDVRRAWWDDNPKLPCRWGDQWYLCAFPQNEIQKGWGLIQNPGWDK